jgi:metal-responsive CopG/Arc/MetJ family transcriptional regulator
MSKKRVVFTFDERSLESLEKLKEQARFDSLAEAVRNSLQVARALQQQKEQGYTEVVVRNPDSKEERVVVIPDL